MKKIRARLSSFPRKNLRLRALVLAGIAGGGVIGGGLIARNLFAPPLAADRVKLPAVAVNSPALRIVAPIPALPKRPLPSFSPMDAGEAGMALRRLQDAAEVVGREVRRGAFPGGALVVGRGERPVMQKGIGRVTWVGEQVTPDSTVYDLASLTKVVGTTSAVMLLVEDGKLDLDAPVSRYLPAFSGGDKDRVTIRHLLTHTSGLPAWAELWAADAEGALRKAIREPLRRDPGERVVYSDIGFVVLYAAAERAAGEPIPDLLQRRIFEPLGMSSTRFKPGEDCQHCAPTLRRSDGTEVRGIVHDPIARHLNGVAGNAGLFSTATDLGRFAAMLANGGQLEGVRVLQEETVGLFTRRQPGADTRALGWDTPDQDGTGAAGLAISPRAFGHTGFTGTSLWVDPERKTWTVLLTNRTYAPQASSRMQSLRRRVHNRVASAADHGGSRSAGN